MDTSAPAAQVDDHAGPDDPEARPGFAIKRAEHALMREKTRVLREIGLSVPQYAAMLVLSRAPDLSGAQLARRCLVTPQSMASLLGILETRGLVHRAHSEVHARVVLARLTPPGQVLLADADRAALAVEQRLAAAFTDAERDQLRTLLARATRTLDELAGDSASVSDP